MIDKNNVEMLLKERPQLKKSFIERLIYIDFNKAIEQMMSLKIFPKIHPNDQDREERRCIYYLHECAKIGLIDIYGIRPDLKKISPILKKIDNMRNISILPFRFPLSEVVLISNHLNILYTDLHIKKRQFKIFIKKLKKQKDQIGVSDPTLSNYNCVQKKNQKRNFDMSSITHYIQKKFHTFIDNFRCDIWELQPFRYYKVYRALWPFIIKIEDKDVMTETPGISYDMNNPEDRIRKEFFNILKHTKEKDRTPYEKHIVEQFFALLDKDGKNSA